MNFYKIFIILFFTSFSLYSQGSVGFVVADTPGAYNSYWHTSLTLTNFFEYDATLVSTLYLSNGLSYKIEFTLPKKKSISKLLIDLLNENGKELNNFFGWIEINESNIPEEFAGFAVMYTPDPNAGEGGIFAEITPAFETEDLKDGYVLYPLTPCGKDSKEPMALGGGVWRTNVGFINPFSKPATVNIDCYDGDMQFLAHTSISLNPKEIKQLNDVKRPDIWNLPCTAIKEPVFCIFENQEQDTLIYPYGANVNNVNNFPIYISPQ